MGDFKIYQSIPEKGKIKVGSADVKKIYKGENWVWPPEDDSYIPPQASPGAEPYFISNVSTRSPIGSTNGFGLLKIKKIAPELFPPDGIAVGFEMVNPAHPFGALPDTAPAAETTDKYRICQVSDDYKYMYAWGRNQQGVQSIVRTEDFGQNWIEITDPAIYNSNFDTYPTLMTASRNGKVICVPYKDRPRTASDSSYYGIAISRDYGVTWEKVADLFYFFMQNSTRPISSVGIPDNDKYGFGISISAGGKYIYIIKFRSLNVYRSSDFGKTFNYITISSGLSDSQYSTRSLLTSVAVSGNGKRVFLFDYYAITTRRYYASNDYGQTFRLVGPFANPVLDQGAGYSRKAYADYEGTKAIFESTDGNDEYMTLISGISESAYGSLTHSDLAKAGELRGQIKFDQGINEGQSSVSRLEAGYLSSNGQFTSTILYPYYPIVLEGTTPILDTLSLHQNHTYTSLLTRYGYGWWPQHHRFLTSIPKIVNIT